MAYGMKTWTASLVNSDPDPAKAYCEYAKQRMGVPHPTAKDLNALRKEAKEFFEEYPHTDWHTLCRVVDWMVSNKRRSPTVHGIIKNYRFAWSRGQLPELDPANAEDAQANQMIQDALKVEKDPLWRKRLILAPSPKSKREVYAAWKMESSVAM